ncbi:uncharacterized membrane protein (DUF485 family) [Azospirillum fermentarium]|uniref:DUF485 domain-containing protein n=1 Tax=Azospirillum fermentarium TaxID=1233114 RepID=UPI002225C78C|nr:DUF485 domain-containing protein [Azospirillum fermentarium]MCW2248819.1 uncharacterized membrane protein (DUF485 family) [Azospirillum fermentarium]
MSEAVYDRVLANPKFAQLTARRNRFSVLLAVVMLGIYYAFVLTVAFNPKLLSLPWSEGLTLTIGLVAGFCITVACIVSTGIYVARANSEFDRLTRELIEEAGQ